MTLLTGPKFIGKTLASVIGPQQLYLKGVGLGEGIDPASIVSWGILKEGLDSFRVPFYQGSCPDQIQYIAVFHTCNPLLCKPLPQEVFCKRCSESND